MMSSSSSSSSSSSNFLPEATSFVGFVKHSRASWMSEDKYIPCPLCQGYCGWNLVLNAYGENKHFNARCNHCDGHGYVRTNSSDATCVPHEMKHTEDFGDCYKRYVCRKCGKSEDIDSSD
jgi:hypothetical protein